MDALVQIPIIQRCNELGAAVGFEAAALARRLTGPYVDLVTDYINAAHTGTAPTLSTQHRLVLARAANQCAAAVYLNDRAWWDTYRSTGVGAENRKTVDSMITVGPPASGARSTANTSPSKPPSDGTKRVIERRRWAWVARASFLAAVPVAFLLGTIPHVHATGSLYAADGQLVQIPLDCGNAGTGAPLSSASIDSQVRGELNRRFGSASVPMWTSGSRGDFSAYANGGSAQREFRKACAEARDDQSIYAVFAAFGGAIPFIVVGALAVQRSYQPRVAMRSQAVSVPT